MFHQFVVFFLPPKQNRGVLQRRITSLSFFLTPSSSFVILEMGKTDVVKVRKQRFKHKFNVLLKSYKKGNIVLSEVDMTSDLNTRKNLK